MMQLFLDCDGVLADFDRVACEIFNLPPGKAEEHFGSEKFWKTLANTPNFYATLPLMPDAMKLYKAVKHLKPIILTGSPRGSWAEPQKKQWARVNFPGVETIVCPSVEKYKHMTGPRDILIDDRTKYQRHWENAGGKFIHHKNAAMSVAELYLLGVL